jgi:hypothetical protein
MIARRLLRSAWDWFWYGDLCSRCRAERTGLWFTDPDTVCDTCSLVARINFRALVEKWSNR